MSAGGAEGRVHWGVGHGVLARGHRVVLLQLYLYNMKASITVLSTRVSAVSPGTARGSQSRGRGTWWAWLVRHVQGHYGPMLLLVTGDQAPVLWQLQTSAR